MPHLHLDKSPSVLRPRSVFGATSQRFERNESVAPADAADTYAGRFRALVAPITMVGGIAMLAALHLPKSSLHAMRAFGDVKPSDDQDDALAKSCLKGAVYVALVPVAALCAFVCLFATLAAYCVCVPYAAFASAPWGASQPVATAQRTWSGASQEA